MDALRATTFYGGLLRSLLALERSGVTDLAVLGRVAVREVERVEGVVAQRVQLAHETPGKLGVDKNLTRPRAALCGRRQ